MGPAWDEVHRKVQGLHHGDGAIHGKGWFRVVHGESPLARFLLWTLEMPEATDLGEVRLKVTPCEHGERWRRTFGNKTLATTQREGPGGTLVENLGGLEFRFRLEVEGGGISYKQEACGLRLGPIYLPFSPWMSPRIEAREEAVIATQLISVLVTISNPITGLVLEYGGNLELQ